MCSLRLSVSLPPPQALTTSTSFFHLLPLPPSRTLWETTQRERKTEWRKTAKKITFPFFNSRCACISLCPASGRESERTAGESDDVRWLKCDPEEKAVALLTLKRDHNVCSAWPECWDHREMHTTAAFVCECVPSFLFNQRASGAEQSGGLNQGPFCRSDWL